MRLWWRETRPLLHWIVAVSVILSLLLTVLPSSYIPNVMKVLDMGDGLGMGEVGAADLAADTVDTLTTDNALCNPNQRSQIYAASHFWTGYSDGTDYLLASSLDGATWSTPTTIKSGVVDGRAVCMWFDSDNLCFTYAPGVANTALQYRQYTPNDDGTLTALSGHDHWETAVAADADHTYYYPSLCKDTSGYPVVAYYVHHTGIVVIADAPRVAKSAQKDGTWTSNTFDTYLTTLTSDVTWKATILPLASQDLMAIYARDGEVINSQVYDFGTTAWLSENATTSAIQEGSFFSAVVTSDSVVHLVFSDNTEDIVYTHYHSGGIAWQTEEDVYAGTSTTMAPVLSKATGDSLACFWMGDPATDHIYYKKYDGTSWTGNPVHWIEDFSITSNSLISSSYEQLSTPYTSVVWLTGDANPYTVRFAALANPSSAYGYSKVIPITGSAGASENYQIPIDVYPGSGTDNAASGEQHAKVYLDNHTEEFPDDIRFLDSDGVNSLDYWSQPLLTREEPISGTASKDTMIALANPTYNYGGNTALFLQIPTGGGASTNALLEFDLSGYGLDTVFKYVEFQIYYYAYFSTFNPAGHVVELFRLSRSDWAEGTGTWATHSHDGASWNHYDASQVLSWTTAGGDYEGNIPGHSVTLAGTGVWLTFDVTEWAQDAFDNHSGKLELYMRFASNSAAGSHSAYFYSREYAVDATLRPKLSTQYYTPSTSPREFWVEVTDDLSDNQSIIMMYGLAGCPNGESGTNTFLAYDDGVSHRRQVNYGLELDLSPAGPDSMCRVGNTIWSVFIKGAASSYAYVYTADISDPYTWTYHSSLVAGTFRSYCSLTTDGTNVWAAYIDTDDDVHLKKWTGSWGSELTVAATATTYSQASIVYSAATDASHINGHLICEYEIYNGAIVYAIRCKVSDSSGTPSWSGEITITNIDPDPGLGYLRREHPQLVVAPNGDILCGFEGEYQEESDSGLFQIRSTNYGDNWTSNPEEVIHAVEVDVDHENGLYITLAGTLWYIGTDPQPTGANNVGQSYTHASTYGYKASNAAATSWDAPILLCGSRDRVSPHGGVELSSGVAFFRYGSHYSSGDLGHVVIFGTVVDTSAPDTYSVWTLDNTYSNIRTETSNLFLAVDGDPLNSDYGYQNIGSTSMTNYAVDVRTCTNYYASTMQSQISLMFDNTTAHYMAQVNASTIKLFKFTGGAYAEVDSDAATFTKRLLYDLSTRAYQSGSDLVLSTAFGDTQTTTLTVVNSYTDNSSPYLDGRAGLIGDYDSNVYPTYFDNIRVRKVSTTGTEPEVGTAESEVDYPPMDISVSPSTWTEFYQEGASTHVHNLRMNSWYTSDNDSNKDYYTLTNNGDNATDVLISSADDWTGTGVTWHVSPTGTPGDHTIGLWAGLDSDLGYTTLVKVDDPPNFLLTDLAASAHDHFGLKVSTCTLNGGNTSMSGTITLTAVVHT